MLLAGMKRASGLSPSSVSPASSETARMPKWERAALFAPRKESESESGPNGTQHAAQSPRAGRSGEIGTPTLRSAASARTAAARQVLADQILGADTVLVGREVVPLERAVERRVLLLRDPQIVRNSDLEIGRQLEVGRLQPHHVRLRRGVIPGKRDPLLEIRP